MGDYFSDDQLLVHSVTPGECELSEISLTWWHYGLYCFARGIVMPGVSYFGRGNRPVINVRYFYNSLKYPFITVLSCTTFSSFTVFSFIYRRLFSSIIIPFTLLLFM